MELGSLFFSAIAFEKLEVDRLSVGGQEMCVPYGKITKAVQLAGFKDFRVVRSEKERSADTLVGILHIPTGDFCHLDPDHADVGLKAAAISAARTYPEGFGRSPL